MQATFCELVDAIESKLPELFEACCLICKRQFADAFPEVDEADLMDAITCLCDEGKLIGHSQDNPQLYPVSIYDSTRRVWYAGVAQGESY